MKINPVLKYDTNKNYGSGFYIKPGLYYSILLSAKEKGTDLNIKSDLNNSLFGFNLGFGVDFSKIIGIEMVFDYSLSNSIKEFENQKIKSKFLSGYFILVINLDQIINNQLL